MLFRNGCLLPQVFCFSRISHSNSPSGPNNNSNAVISGHLGGVDPRDIGGNSVGFANFCRQFVARDGGIGRFCTSKARYMGKELWDL